MKSTRARPSDIADEWVYVRAGPRECLDLALNELASHDLVEFEALDAVLEVRGQLLAKVIGRGVDEQAACSGSVSYITPLASNLGSLMDWAVPNLGAFGCALVCPLGRPTCSGWF